MNIALWIVTGLLALVFLAAGGMKVVRPKEKLAESGLAWAEDFTAPQVKLIGVAEVVGAIGLILPGLTHIAPILVPIAASALAVLMIGATAVHLRRHEPPISLVLVILAIFLAVGRFALAPLS